MKVKILEQGWQQYLQKVIPQGAPELQVAETRKAYYAGAGMLMDSLARILGPGEEATEADVQMVDDIADEIRQFVHESSGQRGGG